MKKNKLKIKAVISTLLVVFGLLSFTTGVILYFLEYGMLWIFTRKLIKNIHGISALVTGILVIFHFYLNWKTYRSEVRVLMTPEEDKTFDK